MEFDIGTLLYIIITIVAIIASVAGKKKKQQGTGSEAAREENSKGFFDRIEDQFGTLMDDAKTSVNQVAEDIGLENETRESYAQHKNGDEQLYEEKDEVDNNNQETAYSDFTGVFNPEMNQNADLIREEAEKSTAESEIIDVIELEESNNPDYFEIVKDFDLSTAVIYSTIINRKEY